MYPLVAVGGTFDHLHLGHEALLTAAFRAGERVLIGLTSDEMAGKKSGAVGCFLGIESYEQRKRQVEHFLAQKNWRGRGQITRIDDIYGPLVHRRDVAALVVSPETISGARLINQKRRHHGLPRLTILMTPLTLAQDLRRISSTRIRQGKIDRVGRVYRHLPVFGMQVSEGVRQRLKEPLGAVIQTAHLIDHPLLCQASFVITVGDVVTKTLNAFDVDLIDIAIVDYRVNRKAVHHSLEDVGYNPKKIRNVIVTSAKNPPGWMTRTVTEAVQWAISSRCSTNRRQVVRVIGEEDLVGIPAILFAPLGTVVLYGQPPFAGNQEGMVLVEVTEEKKREVLHLLGIDR